MSTSKGKPAPTSMDVAEKLKNLTDSQLKWVSGVIDQFALWHEFQIVEKTDAENNPVKSDLVNEEVLFSIGDTLRIHHAFSRQPLTKDRFEFAFESALNVGGHTAKLVKSRTNRGHDMTVNQWNVSLKTEAAAAIRPNSLHISKFMELGKGDWELELLRDAFLKHMESYHRIFSFRCLEQGPQRFYYELVEIPKALFEEGANAKLVTQTDSKQKPQPGYGYVYDKNKELKFALYFDGGTERKLQIKNINKKYCQVHATWQFESAPLEAEDNEEQKIAASLLSSPPQ